MKFRMNFLTLRFKNAHVEAEFGKLFQSISPRFYHTIIALLTISAIIFAILCFNVSRTWDGVGLVAGSIALFALLWYRNRCRKIIPVIVFIAAEALLGVGLYYTKIPFDNLPPRSIFYEGFSFGMFTLLVSQFFPKLPAKMTFIIIAIIVRYSVLVPETLGGILVNSVFDVATIFLFFYQEKNIRDLFKRFHEYRDELSKFKSLLVHHIPQNIAIINKDLDQQIFINNSFTTKFKAESIGQILQAASSLRIIRNTYEKGTSSELDALFQSLPNPTLYDFLFYCKNNSENPMQIACFNVTNTDPEEAQVTYEARIFNLNWDDCEALTIMLNDLTVQETIMALRLADENKDKVLATVSHELRTPINGMLGITNLIEQEFQDVKLREYCKAAKICSKMLLNLVNSILDLSQIRNNCIKLNPTSFTIKELLDEIESIFHSQCLNKGLEFKIVSEDEDSKIISDRSRLTQVIVNLLANALKFTFQGGITLKVVKNSKVNEVNFLIQDTGTGIKEEDKPKLFKMFGRLEQTDSTINTQGVGLGLTISNSLVKLLNPTKQNAKIDLESEYGKGTTFSFAISTKLIEPIQSTEDEDYSTLENLFFPEDKQGYARFPVSISEFSSKPDPMTPRVLPTVTPPVQKLLLSPSMLSRMNRYKDTDTQQGSFTATVNTEEKDLLIGSPKLQPKRTKTLKLQDVKESMLVVDDNALNLMIVAKLIEKKGYLVTTAFNGEDAIKKVKEQDKSAFFKVILMDCQMPIMDGYEATRILNQMMDAGEAPRVPIFALTANDTKQDQEKCLSAGMAAYLSKPLNEFELQKAIDKFAK